MAGEEGGGGRWRLRAEGPYFAQLWETVLLDHRLRPAAKVLYAVMQRCAARGGFEAVMPTQAELAKLSGLNRETVGTCLRELASAGHIVRRRSGKGYEVILISPRDNDADALFSGIALTETHVAARHSENTDAGKSASQEKSSEKFENVTENPSLRDGKSVTSGEDSFKEKREESTPPTPLEGGETSARGRGRPAYTQEFMAFWTAYPHTNGTKVEAFKAWRRLKPEDRAAAAAGLLKWIASDLWREGKICYPQKYLNTRMWEEEPAAEPVRNGRRREDLNAAIVQPDLTPRPRPLPSPEEQDEAEAAVQARRQEGDLRLAAAHAWLADEAQARDLPLHMMPREAGLDLGWEEMVRLGIARYWRPEWTPYYEQLKTDQHPTPLHHAAG